MATQTKPIKKLVRFEFVEGVKIFASDPKHPQTRYGILDNRTHQIYPFIFERTARQALEDAKACPAHIRIFWDTTKFFSPATYKFPGLTAQTDGTFTGSYNGN